MVTVKGGGIGKRVIAQLPAQIEAKLLRGAARAGGAVVLDEAKQRVTSDDVREGLTMNAKAEPGRVVVKINVKAGWARSVGTWLEYGTASHFISVDDSQRGGRSVNRINRLEKGGSTLIAGARRVNKEGEKGSLVIGGNFVGETVHHPGARPHPFLRVSLDLKEAEAVAAAQSYINSRVKPSGIVGGDTEPQGDEA